MTDCDRTVPGPRHSEAGFSLIEGLIAAALLLLVLVSILPLFTQSMLNNATGNDSSYISNAAVDGFERISSLPFDNFQINVIAGATPEIVTTDLWARQGDTWVTDISQSPVANDETQFTRTSTIRQYSSTDLTDDGDADTALDPGDPNATLKVVQYRVTGQRRIGAPAFDTVLVKSKG